MDTKAQPPVRGRVLDLLLVAWGAIVILRFSAPYLGLQVQAMWVESSRLHVAVLGMCLALAAIGAALHAVGSR